MDWSIPSFVRGKPWVCTEVREDPKYFWAEHAGFTGGNMRTASLFVEFRRGPYEPVFTFKRELVQYKDRFLVPFRELYLDCLDPTDYTLAINVFNNYQHYQKIRANGQLKPFFDVLEQERTVKLRSTLWQANYEVAMKGNTPALKWVLENLDPPAKRTTSNKRGRPSSRAETPIEEDTYEEHFERVKELLETT